MFVEFESRCAYYQNIAHNDAKKATSLYCPNPIILFYFVIFNKNKSINKTKIMIRHGESALSLYLKVLIFYTMDVYNGMIIDQIFNSTSFKCYLIFQSVKHHQKN